MIDFSNLKSLKIPEGEVKKIECNGVVLWKAGYTNLVPLSTEDDDKTIYNGGKGYKDGYRIRSGGAEDAKSTASCTGFMRVSAGDKVRLSGYDVKYVDNTNAINVYDANHTNLGQISGNYWYGCFTYGSQSWDDVILEKDNVYYWIVPDGYGIAYIRVTGYTGGDGSKMIVTVNEEITADYQNQIPLSVNADDTPYAGLNGEKGYKTGYRINSSGVEVEQSGMCCTGFIRYKAETIRLKGITPTGTKQPYIVRYRSDKTFWTVNSLLDILTDDGTGVYTGSIPSAPDAWIRITCGVIDDTSILTIDEEIT